jgi:hypothetical protein
MSLCPVSVLASSEVSGLPLVVAELVLDILSTKLHDDVLLCNAGQFRPCWRSITMLLKLLEDVVKKLAHVLDTMSICDNTVRVLEVGERLVDALREVTWASLAIRLGWRPGADGPIAAGGVLSSIDGPIGWSRTGDEPLGESLDGVCRSGRPKCLCACSGA